LFLLWGAFHSPEAPLAEIIPNKQRRFLKPRPDRLCGNAHAVRFQSRRRLPPGGNITGIFLQQLELTAKRLQVVKEAFPELQAATVFWDELSADQWRAAESAAPALGLHLFGSELREQPYDYERALARAPEGYRSWLFVMTSAFLFRDRARTAEFALRHRAASVFAFREWVDDGGLLSYGPNIVEMFRRAADYVDRIARGAKPSDLPIARTRSKASWGERDARPPGHSMRRG
jgi:ABC-type uncharacterized transport system substrate-binding protein